MIWVAICAYLVIGATVAFGMLWILKYPPERDAEWETMRGVFWAQPERAGPALFLVCVLGWPIIFFSRRTK